MPCPDMTWVRFKIKREIGVFSIQRSQPPFPSSASPPPIATHHGNGGYEKQPIQTPPRPSWSGKISPAVLFIIVILAAVVFIGGLLHLLVKFLMKHRPFSGGGSQESNSNTNNNRMSGSDDAVQRQLQQLFHLHDSGLDQASIDALPVFVYKEIIGSLKEPFDCAVCLCEFSEMDKLRLVPFCSHAFHIDCIDTWLLSNSTCPLCRGSLYTSCFTIQNPIFDLEDPREEGFSMSSCSGETLPESSILNLNQRRVFSVRLGKLRSCSGFRIESRGETSGGGSGSNIMSSTTNRNLDPRRCYSSMGSYQYVVSELELQVPAAFCLSSSSRNVGGSMRSVRGGVDGDQGKRISIASKGESFSVSKIWLWPKKTKLPTSSETHNHNHNRGSNLRLT